jgi:hypothetical protein
VRPAWMQCHFREGISCRTAILMSQLRTSEFSRIRARPPSPWGRGVPLLRPAGILRESGNRYRNCEVSMR